MAAWICASASSRTAAAGLEPVGLFLGTAGAIGGTAEHVGNLFSGLTDIDHPAFCGTCEAVHDRPGFVSAGLGIGHRLIAHHPDLVQAAHDSLDETEQGGGLHGYHRAEGADRGHQRRENRLYPTAEDLEGIQYSLRGIRDLVELAL